MRARGRPDAADPVAAVASVATDGPRENGGPDMTAPLPVFDAIDVIATLARALGVLAGAGLAAAGARAVADCDDSRRRDSHPPQSGRRAS